VPSSERWLTADDVRRHARDRCFASGNGRIGLEIEWLAVPLDDPTTHVDERVLREALATVPPLPRGGALTMEPGGQLEIASVPTVGVSAACAAIATDAQVLQEALHLAGIGLVGLGLEPARPLRRLVRGPRYDAMEAYFDATAVGGRRMMQGTASLQLNLDVGRPHERSERWRVAHLVGPVLCAAFANSPILDGHDSGWASARLRTWWDLDPSRTAPVPLDGGSVWEAWARYALSARVMLVRRGPDDYAPLLVPVRFDDWIANGHELGYPTLDDLEYHLSTLFPPIRPRGWLELRMFDAVPDPWWRVVVALGTVLLDDPSTRRRAAAAARPVAGRWRDASQRGLAEPALRDAALSCFDAALDGLERVGGDDSIAELVAAFRDRYVRAGRTLADDQRDAWRTTGQLYPQPDGVPEPAWT